MEWNHYDPTFRAFANVYRLPKMSNRATVGILRRDFRVATSNQAASTNSEMQLINEAKWVDNGRPFYNLWPSVIEPFGDIDLSKVSCKEISLPLPQIMVRCPKGSSVHGAICSLVSEMNVDDARGLQFCISDGSYYPSKQFSTIPVHTISSFELIPDHTVEERLQWCQQHPYCDDPIDYKMISACVKIAVSLSLLRNNPDLIEPLPLEADRKKWEETHDMKYIEKAARRGKKEWDVGKHVVVTPGFRRPHFAIRWMGRGVGVEKKPVLRPIRGCLVQRESVISVPTGFLDESEEP